jgi:hypothetical protein
MIGLLALFILSACEKPELIGAALLKDNQINTLYTDSLTVQLSTVQLDSVRSSLSGLTFVGSYKDPAFGQISAEGYMQFAPFGGVFADSTVLLASAKADSLLLYLPYFNTQGDTLSTFNLKVHQLKNIIDTTRTLKTFYIADKSAYQATPLANLNFAPRSRSVQSPTLRDTLKVKLPLAMAKEIFSKSLKTETASGANFSEYFKGLALVSGASNKAILGFDFASCRMRLFYRKQDTVKYYKDFVPYNNHYNNITNNRAGTKIAALQKSFDQIKATKANDEAYMQNSTGVVMKIEMPYLSKFKTAAGKVSINKAELVFQPEVNPVNSPIPPSSFLYETDFTNKLLKNISGLLLFVPSEGQSLSTTTPVAQASEAFKTRQSVAYSEIDNKFSIPLTSYIQAILLDKRANKGLLLLPSSDTDFARMIVKNSKMKLQIYYTYTTN